MIRSRQATIATLSLLGALSVQGAEFTLPDVTIGNNLQTSATLKLSEPAGDNGLQITVKSDDPAKLRFSRRPDVAGTESIVISLQAGFGETPDFWLHGFAESGEATYTVSAPGFTGGKGKVTLSPSSLLIVGPFRAPRFPTTTGAAPSRIIVYSARLNDKKEFAEQQAIAGGISVDVELTSSEKKAGDFAQSKLTLAGGTPSAATEFRPAGPGSTTLTASVPKGFSPPPANYAKVVAAVSLPGISITNEVMIGQNLQIAGNVGLGEAARAGGVEVTLTSEDETQLVLSKTATEVGSKSITIRIAENGIGAQYFLQGLGKSGTVSYTAVAKGYQSRLSRVGLAPSGVVIAPKPYGPPDEAELFRKGNEEGARGFVSHLSKKAKMPLAVWTAQLDPVTLRSADITVQPLRAGMSLKINVESSNPQVGKVVSPVVIKGGEEHGSSEFTPLGLGSTTITVVTPDGFTKSFNSTTVAAMVKE